MSAANSEVDHHPSLGETKLRLGVYVAGCDPVSVTGIVTQLGSRPEFAVVAGPSEATVAVVAFDRFTNEAAQAIRSLCRGGCQVVLVLSGVDDMGLAAAVEAGACAVVRRSEASAEYLARVVAAANDGHGALAPDLLGVLMASIGRWQNQADPLRHHGLSGFSDRERDVLGLLADGFDTAEIANKLSYSERTVKNVLHSVTKRLNLKNRTHAVAYALRSGVI